MERWEIRTTHTDTYTDDGEYSKTIDVYLRAEDGTRICTFHRDTPGYPTESERRRAQLAEAAPELLEALVSRGTHDGECHPSEGIHSDACRRDADLLRRLR